MGDPPAPRRSRRRRAFAWGLGISVALHIILFFLATRIWFPSPEGSASGPTGLPDQGGRPEMQAIRLDIRSDAATVDDATRAPTITLPEPTPTRRDPAEEVQPPTPEPAATPGREGEPGRSGEGARRSPAERLRPEYVEPRLWERPDAPPEPEKTDFERARDRVYARIEALNDSLALEGEAARRATDWTFSDKDGKKWGVSPGKLHLGGVTLPLPINLSPPPDQARARRDREGKAAEIERHGDRARIRGTFDDQVRSARERRERERAAGRGDTTKTGGND